MCLWAVAQQDVIDELRAIVGVYAKDGEWKGGLGLLDRLDTEPLGPTHECGADGPSGGDIGHVEGVDVFAPGVATAVGYEVDLKEARLVLVPVGERADRYLVFEKRAWLCGRAALEHQAFPGWCKESVHSGRADGK